MLTIGWAAAYIFLIVTSFGVALLLLVPHYLYRKARPLRCPFCETHLEQVYERGPIPPPSPPGA